MSGTWEIGLGLPVSEVPLSSDIHEFLIDVRADMTTPSIVLGFKVYAGSGFLQDALRSSQALRLLNNVLKSQRRVYFRENNSCAQAQSKGMSLRTELCRV